MPILEFKCKKCGHVMDSIVKFNEKDQLLPCPNCNEKDSMVYVDKILPSSFQLKGRGWFKDGY